MLISFHKGAGGAADAVKRRLRALLPGVRIAAARGGLKATGLLPGAAADAVPILENLPGVLAVTPELTEECPLALSRQRARLTAPFGRGFALIAGPCTVTDEASYLADAEALKRAGARALRAALFKPRSSPYAFQGLGFAGLKIALKARKLTGLPLVTEALDTRHVARLAGACDVLQVGARNMRNYELLKELGAARVCALLKRAPGATLREWLLSAEYLLRHGVRGLMLCERGDGPGGRPGLNLALLRQAKQITGFPVLADPSHAARERNLAARLALKAALGGADGLLIEASLSPLSARVDGRQTVTVRTFSALAAKVACEKKK